jgi:hypothetical protein
MTVDAIKCCLLGTSVEQLTGRLAVLVDELLAETGAGKVAGRLTHRSRPIAGQRSDHQRG